MRLKFFSYICYIWLDLSFPCNEQENLDFSLTNEFIKNIVFC